MESRHGQIMGEPSPQPQQQSQASATTLHELQHTVDMQYPSRQRLSEEQIAVVEASLKTLLANTVCKQFLTGTLRELRNLPTGVYSTDPLEIFAAVKNQPEGGLFSDKRLLPGEGTAFGSLEKGNAEISFGSLTGLVAAHEIFHVAAKAGQGYSHIDMAQAAFASAAAMNLKVFSDFPKSENYKTHGAFSKASATYFAQALFDACQRIKPVWVT